MKKLLRRALYTLSIFAILCCIAIWASVKLRETDQLADILPAGGMRVETAELTVHITPKGTPSDTPILLIHGTGSWGGYWAETSEILSKNNYYALALDVPPFGYSDHAPNGAYDRVTQAKRIIATVEALQTKPIVLAHSFGASVALESVLQAPNKFAGIVIVSGAVGVDAHKDAPDALSFPLSNRTIRRAGVALTSTNPLMTERLIRSFVHDKSLDVSKYARILEQPSTRVGTTAAQADWFTSLLLPPKNALSTREEEIAKLTLPTAMIWGDKDEVSPLKDGQALQKLIDGSTLAVMPNIGHIPQIENVDLFHQHLLTALAQISGGAN